jgi:TonB family protein
MSLILLVEHDGPMAEQVRRALNAEGRRVEVVPEAAAGRRYAAQNAPQLVLVGQVEGASELVVELASASGGPGALALVAEGGEAPPRADGSLELPCSDEQLRVSVRSCLAKLNAQAARSAAAEAASAGAQLTSKELFGDVLEEVEREVAAGSASPSRPAMKAPTAPRDLDEVDRKLEQTLSGVLGSSLVGSSTVGAGATKAKPAGQDTGVDDLLNQTLSGLGMIPKRPGQIAKPASGGHEPASTERPAPPPHSAPEPAPAPEPPPPVAEEPPAGGRAESPEAAPAPAPKAKSAGAVEPQAGPAAESPPEAAASSQLQESYETQRMAAITGPIPAPPGKHRELGPYTLLERVAVGGMAEVWKARMQGVEGFQKTVAIKRILPQLTDSVEFVTMFIDEAKLAAQLNHPHIIHIYDLGKIDDDYYIAMEFVEGKDLRSILEASRKHERRLPRGLALLIAARLASALDHAHRKRGFDGRELGLVHRDVSPQNVLISYEGDIKLCDFGIVKAVVKASKTQMGALKGKLQYMSPEQASGRVVDSRSDIFSLGAVLFEMLTGERLFAGDSEITVLEAVREGRIRSPREIDASLPRGVEEIVVRALARDPEQRHQSAGALQQELDAVLYGLKPTPAQADLARYMSELFADQREASAAHGAVEEGAAASAAAQKAGRPTKARADEGKEVEAVAPAAGFEGVREERQGSWALWAGAAAGLALLLSGAFFAYRSLAERPRPEAAPVVAVVDPVETSAASSAIEGSLGEAEDSQGAVGGELDLESMVDSELQAREEVMRRQFEEERGRLERELEQVETPTSPPAAVTPPPESAPVVAEPTPEETTAAAVPEPAPVEAREPAPLGEVETTPDPAVEEVSPEAPPQVAPAAPPAAGPAMEEPPPAPVEPPPPPRPAVREGDLVDMNTPGLVPARRIDMRPPTYPPQARRLGREGTVTVRVLVSERGEVVEAQLEGEEAGFGMDQAALTAARTARYQPATVDGVPVRIWVTLTFPFRL